jgi:hypothetical protein
VGDVALVWLLWVGTSEWPADQATNALRALLCWMLFSKFIKLVTHFVRYPVDILLWPVSILFGWFHGIIKFYAMVTLNEVRASSPPSQPSPDWTVAYGPPGHLFMAYAVVFLFSGRVISSVDMCPSHVALSPWPSLD